jgi:hypothetical protein
MLLHEQWDSVHPGKNIFFVYSWEIFRLKPAH